MSEHPDPHVARLAALPVSVVADVLDRLGHQAQTMEHTVRPLPGTPPPLTGRAFTIGAGPSDVVLENPYEHELAAVDATPAGAVVLLATGALLDVAAWGQLLTTRMLARGGVGVVTDGGIRDVAGIRRLGVPAFAASVTPRPSFGRALVTGFGEPVRCARVEVATGDLVRGDEDGVVVVPAAVGAAAVGAAEEKLGLERAVQEALALGETAAGLYERYGVL